MVWYCYRVTAAVSVCCAFDGSVYTSKMKCMPLPFDLLSNVAFIHKSIYAYLTNLYMVSYYVM